MKIFGKKLLLAGCAMGLVLSMTACSDIQNHAYAVADQTNHVVTMPAQYSITYEVQNPDHAVTLVTKSCDAKGNIYFSNGEKEMLFIKNSGEYSLYEKGSDGNFVKAPGGKLYTSDYINTAAADFTECVDQAEMQFTPGFEEAEETMLLGRTCRNFKNKIGVSGMNTTYVLQIDKESGICLGYNEVSDTGIFTSEPSETVFSCTEFITNDVNLPVDFSALQL